MTFFSITVFSYPIVVWLKPMVTYLSKVCYEICCAPVFAGLFVLRHNNGILGILM